MEKNIKRRMYTYICITDSLLYSKNWHAAAAAKSLQSCPILCDPMDCSPPGSSVPGIFQARVLEWGAVTL